MLKLEDQDCDPNGNGNDPDSSNDESDLKDYNDDEVKTNDSPEENQN